DQGDETLLGGGGGRAGAGGVPVGAGVALPSVPQVLRAVRRRVAPVRSPTLLLLPVNSFASRATCIAHEVDPAALLESLPETSSSRGSGDEEANQPAWRGGRGDGRRAGSRLPQPAPAPRP